MLSEERSSWWGLRVGFLSVVLVGAAAEQSEGGGIAGSVLDSTGAAVTGESVTLKGVDTGSIYKTVSSSSGGYRVNDLAIGHYDVKVEAAGFKTSLKTGVEIQINTVASLNVTLQPRDVKEEATILADPPTLQTESSAICTVVTANPIQALPLSPTASSHIFFPSPPTSAFVT